MFKIVKRGIQFAPPEDCTDCKFKHMMCGGHCNILEWEWIIISIMVGIGFGCGIWELVHT